MPRHPSRIITSVEFTCSAQSCSLGVGWWMKMLHRKWSLTWGPCFSKVQSSAMTCSVLPSPISSAKTAPNLQHPPKLQAVTSANAKSSDQVNSCNCHSIVKLLPKATLSGNFLPSLPACPLSSSRLNSAAPSHCPPPPFPIMRALFLNMKMIICSMLFAQAEAKRPSQQQHTRELACCLL